MKKVIVLIFFLISIGTAQESLDPIDSLRITTVVSSGLFPHKVIEAYSSGMWRPFTPVMPVFLGVDRAVDTTNSVSTPVNLGGMNFKVTTGYKYKYKFTLIYSSSIGGCGISLGLTAPQNIVLSAMIGIYGTAAEGSSSCHFGAIDSSGQTITSTKVDEVNHDYTAVIDGIIIPAETGTVQLIWCPETNNAVTLKRGSVGEIWIY
jgi:hypothetical protein